MAQLALPHNLRLPPKSFETADIPQVALAVFCQLRHPELKPGFRQSSQCATRMPMPKAAMHEYRFLAAKEDQIRFARKILSV